MNASLYQELRIIAAVAVAAIGEAVEWPARAVLALARLPDSDGVQTRRLLEEGLDLWAHECGLGSLDPIAVEESETSSRSANRV